MNNIILIIVLIVCIYTMYSDQTLYLMRSFKFCMLHNLLAYIIYHLGSHDRNELLPTLQLIININHCFQHLHGWVMMKNLTFILIFVTLLWSHIYTDFQIKQNYFYTIIELLICLGLMIIEQQSVSIVVVCDVIQVHWLK